MLAETSRVDEAEQLRTRVYGLLARLLARPPSSELLSALARLDGDATPLGRALGALAAAAATTVDDARREYEALFVGVVRGEVVPYGSFYLTGFLHDRPLGRLRRDLAALGIERAPGVVEPEDHLASECEVMAGLIDGSLGDGDAAAAARFFQAHLRPWARHCFADIETSESARLYRAVGALGRVFLDIEVQAFAFMAEPNQEPLGGISHERNEPP